MCQFTQEGDFAYDIARHAAFGSRIGVGDAFDSHGAIGGTLGATVDGAVGSLSNEIGAGIL